MKTTSTTKPAGTFKRSAITSQELEEIKAEHIPDERGYACACCEEPWPCDKVRLVARIEELRAIVFDDRTARCPAWSVVGGVQRQCKFPNGHAGTCQKVALAALGGEG